MEVTSFPRARKISFGRASHLVSLLLYLHGLGVHGHDDAEVLGDSVEEEAAHPQVVAHLNTFARSDLELPLSGHDLGVGAGDVHAGV